MRMVLLSGAGHLMIITQPKSPNGEPLQATSILAHLLRKRRESESACYVGAGKSLELSTLEPVIVYRKVFLVLYYLI